MSIWGKLLLLFVFGLPTSEKEQNKMKSCHLVSPTPSPMAHCLLGCIGKIFQSFNYRFLEPILVQNQFSQTSWQIIKSPRLRLLLNIFQIHHHDNISSILKWDFCKTVLYLAGFFKPSKSEKYFTNSEFLIKPKVVVDILVVFVLFFQWKIGNCNLKRRTPWLRLCINFDSLYVSYFLEFLFPFHRKSASALQDSRPFVLLFSRIYLMNIQNRPRMPMKIKKLFTLLYYRIRYFASSLKTGEGALLKQNWSGQSLSRSAKVLRGKVSSKRRRMR